MRSRVNGHQRPTGPAPRTAGAGRAGAGLPVWLVAGALVLVLAAVVVRLAQDRAVQRSSMQTRAAPTPEQVQLPPHFALRLIEKAELLRDDLSRTPDSPLLLG